MFHYTNVKFFFQALGVQGGEKDEEVSNGEFNFVDFQHDVLVTKNSQFFLIA